jgi:ankyrin repeat protein
VALALDSQGSLFVVGTLDRDNFAPPPRAYQRARKGKRDVVVAKFDRGLTRLLAATYLGGSENDTALTVAVDRRGEVYVAGVTESGDFPVTAGTLGPSCRGGGDIFVAVFDNQLRELRRATYLGGAREDGARSRVKLLLEGDDVLVAGATASPDFSVTAGTASTVHKGGPEVFVARLDRALARVKAAALVGGTDSENVMDMARSANGGVYVAGYTSSRDFPFQTGGFLSKQGGMPRAYVIRLAADLRAIEASAGIDTPRHTFVYGLALDGEDNVYITGHAHAGFPTTPGVFRERLEGWPDGAYVARLTPDLTRLAASSFIHGGGEGADAGDSAGWDIAVDRRGRVVVTGGVKRLDFPVTRGAFDEFNADGVDGFVAIFDRELRRIEAATVLGGGEFEKPVALLAAPDGSLYCAGVTGSPDFPVSARAYGRKFDQRHSCFITRFGGDLGAPARRPEQAPSGLTPLHWAAIYNQAELAEGLISRGAQPNQANPTGQTPLHFSARYGGAAAVTTLLRHGASLEARDQDGNTPLHLAVSHHYAGMVRQLLAAGAAVNARNARQQTPLHLAVFPMDNQEICGLLIDAGADENALDGNHRIALQDAVRGWGNCAPVLLEKGADPNIGDKEGKTVLHHAVAYGNSAKGLVGWLLSRGADPNRPDRAGQSPLMLAREKKFDALVAILEKR